MLKKIVFMGLVGICAFSNMGCNLIDPCVLDCWADHYNQTVEYANSINPELTDAYINPENPYYNGGSAPVEGFNHGQIRSFEVRVNRFSENLPPCECP